MHVDVALLEEWMRRYYFDTDIDIGSSGAGTFSFEQVRRLTGLTLEDLDRVRFDDSQTLGGFGVRAAVAERSTGGDLDRVMVTHGSSEANFLVMHALLEPGDEVVVLDPAYQQLHGICTAIGCRLRRWRLRPEDGFAPDLAALRHLVTERTRMVVVNFPHNPTGVSLHPEQQRELVEIVAGSQAYLVWDAAFAEITYDAPPLPPPDFYPRAVTLGTLSKNYGLPGLRVGWCLAAPEVLSRCVRMRDYVSLHLSPLVELIAQRVIAEADRFVANRRELAATNLDVLEKWVADHDPGARMTRPAGGVCAFVEFPAAADLAETCRGLAERQRVLLIPGRCFGPAYDHYARLGFGGPSDELETGLRRVSATPGFWGR
ncbi:capreomycidine synthase [Actinophytocola sp.]|uniref:capreomycidine synthase n=1 Tax=Actinophytocola sp. TaxID=1872138 RepID=UPI003D6B8AB7